MQSPISQPPNPQSRVITIHLLGLRPETMQLLEQILQAVAALAIFHGGNQLYQSRPMEPSDVRETVPAQ